MRTLAIALLLSSVAVASADEPQSTTQRQEARTLSAEEVSAYAAPYYPRVRACYFRYGLHARGSTGEMSIKLVVRRDGYVRDVVIDAPGVRGRALRQLDTCIRLEALGWHFPVRRDLTTAILPYHFLYLNLPGAGPHYSCWNPRGCRSRTGRPR
jgi:hypothetical protein